MGADFGEREVIDRMLAGEAFRMGKIGESEARQCCTEESKGIFHTCIMPGLRQPSNRLV